MSKDDAKQPKPMSAKERAAALREERLRKQLRENLHRRKEQSRARSKSSADGQST